MKTVGIFSKQTDEWGTPQELFDQLNNEFNFTLDPCSTVDNHKCSKFFTASDDGLSHDWSGERVFINPPYSQSYKWVEKAWHESHKPNTLCVLLLPARTDTKYFHDFCLNRSEVRFLKGRLKFVGGGTSSAPFPSMLVIFRAAGVK